MVKFVANGLSSHVPARLHYSIWLVANATGESRPVALLVTQELGFNFIDMLHRIMDSSTVKKTQISTVMWSL